MKKVLSIVLAIAMIATMSAVAFANPVDKVANGNEVIPVNGTYEYNEQADTYRVEISWKTLAFTFTIGEKWDTVEHKYVSTGTGTWSEEIEDAITVTNHSSLPVTATASTQPIDGVTLTIDTELKNLTKWGVEGNAVSYDLAAGGALAQGHDGSIGTVTIAIGNIGV